MWIVGLGKHRSRPWRSCSSHYGCSIMIQYQIRWFLMMLIRRSLFRHHLEKPPHLNKMIPSFFLVIFLRAKDSDSEETTYFPSLSTCPMTKFPLEKKVILEHFKIIGWITSSFLSGYWYYSCPNGQCNYFIFCKWFVITDLKSWVLW